MSKVKGCPVGQKRFLTTQDVCGGKIGNEAFDVVEKVNDVFIKGRQTADDFMYAFI